MAKRTQKQQNEYDALVTEYHKLARKADASLRAIESYQYDKNFKVMMKWSYAKAQKEIKRFGGTKRFDTKEPENKQTLKAKINAINEFLDSETRTKTQVRKMFIEKADKINMEYGTNLKWSDVGEFFESEAWEKLDSIYGSKTAMRVVGSLKKKRIDIVNKINEASKKHKKVSDDEIEKMVGKNLDSIGLTIEDLY